MKNSTLLILLVFAGSKVMAQQDVEVKMSNLFFSMGPALPSTPDTFADYWGLGFNFGLGYGYSPIPALAILATFDYNVFGFNEDDFLRDAGFGGFGLTVDGGAVSIITVAAGIKAGIPRQVGSVSPYFSATVGLFSASTQDATVSFQGQTQTAQGSDDTGLSVIATGGLDIPVGATVDIFLQAGYGIGFIEEENIGYIPIKGGVNFRL